MKPTKINPSKFKPLEKKRTFIAIVDQIKELVYSGKYKPNDKLPPERELAIQFNAGRLAVREALRVLEDSGFITIKQGSRGGAFIRPINPKVLERSLTDFIMLGNVDIQELTESRLTLEQSVGEFAIKRITDEEMESLHQNIMNTMKQGKEGGETSSSNINFHMLLAKAAKNRIFETLLASIMDIYIVFLDKWNVDTEFKANHVNEHVKIYEALKSRDLIQLRNAISDHILSISEHFSKAQKKKKKG